MQNLRHKKVIVVKKCLDCPFSKIDFSELYCTGTDKRKNHYISLVSQAVDEWIPDWCPLPNQVFIKDA